MKNLTKLFLATGLFLVSARTNLFAKRTIWAIVALLNVHPLFAQYSNATLNGPWRWHSVPFNPDPDSTLCLVFDGNGNITDVLAFQFSKSGSTYSVSSSGVFSGSISLDQSLISITGQLISQNILTVTIADANFTGPFSRITNPGALTDSLVGVLSGNYGQKNITLVLNSQGQVISSTGLTAPVSGSVYADSGMFVGHIRTGDLSSNPWNEFTITGTYVNNSLNGILSVDASHSTGYGTVQLTRTGIVTPNSVRTINASTPAFFSLNQNYPNPFNPSTIISFSVPIKSHVTLKVFDILGREVATLVSEEMSAGNHSQQWNAVNISSGVYFYRLQAGSYTETKKLVLLR